MPGTYVVDTDGVNGADVFRGVSHGDVSNELLHVDRRGDADEEQELAKGSVQPDTRDDDGQDSGTHGIDPPTQLGTADRRQNTEAIDEQVVAVILPQNVDLRVLILESPAVQEEAQL